MERIERRLRRRRADYLATVLLLPWCLLATAVALATLGNPRFDEWRAVTALGDALSLAIWIWRRS